MSDDPMQIDLERPDEYEEVGDEIYCWMPGNFDRECSGECVAYDLVYEGDQRRSPCSILNMFKSVAMSQAKVANMVQTKARASAVPSQAPPEVK